LYLLLLIHTSTYQKKKKSESEKSDCEGTPPLEDSDGDELALPVEESWVNKANTSGSGQGR
jgi:hypothetical protein